MCFVTRSARRRVKKNWSDDVTKFTLEFYFILWDMHQGSLMQTLSVFLSLSLLPFLVAVDNLEYIALTHIVWYASRFSVF